MSNQEISDGDIIDKYLQYVEVNKSDKWFETVRRSVNEFHEWLDTEYKELDDVDGPTIVDYVTHLKSEGYADSSIDTRLGGIREGLKFADRRDWIDVDYDKEARTGLYTKEVDLSYQAKKAKADEEEIYYLSKDQIDSLIDASNNLRDSLLFTLMYQTGIRAGEASEIKISDIDRDEQKIKIKSEKKSDLETRPVFYQSSLEPLLYDWIGMGQRQAWTNAPVEQNEGYLFVTQQGPYMQPLQINKMVRRRADDAGIQEVRYTDASGDDRLRVTSHTLRHTFAVHRLKSGMPIRFLQKLMGHSNIETTEQYLKVLEKDIKDAYFEYLP